MATTITQQTVPVSADDLHIGLVIGGEDPAAGRTITDVYPTDGGVRLALDDGSTRDLSDTEQLPITLPLHDALMLVGETSGVEGLALMASVLLASQEQTQKTLEALNESAQSDTETYAKAFTRLWSEVDTLNEDKLDSRRLGYLLSDVSSDFYHADKYLRDRNIW